MSFSYSSTVPIELLPGIGKRTAKVLRTLHIRTIGEFKRVPERVLIELFGPSIKGVYWYVQNTNPKTAPPSKKLPLYHRFTKQCKVAALTLTHMSKTWG